MFGRKVPIWAVHHFFLESRDPEVTKVYIMFCPLARAKHPFLQAPANGLIRVPSCLNTQILEHSFKLYLWFNVQYNLSYLYFRENERPTIIHKTFETNFSFHVKQGLWEKFKSFFKSFLLVLTKLLFWQEDRAPGYHSMKFKHFPDIFYVLCLKSFGSS